MTNLGKKTLLDIQKAIAARGTTPPDWDKPKNEKNLERKSK